MRSKRVAAGVGLALLGAIVALAVCEAGLRLAGLAPVPLQYGDNVRDDAIGYRRRPLSSIVGRSESGEFDFRYDHNSLGFRDGEHAVDKPPGTRRIVAIGDSFTYGVGADDDATYPAELERRLNARPHRPRVEIVKLGLPRQFPLLERLTLEEYGWDFSPDLVLLTLLPNDLVDSERGGDAVCVGEHGYLVPCAAGHWSPAALSAYMHFAVVRLAVHAWNRPRADAAVEKGAHEGGWRAIEAEIGEILRETRERSAVLVVVALPQRPPWSAEDAEFERRLGAWCAANGVEFVPTLAAMREASSTQTLYWPRDGHCTAAGYGVVAGVVARALDARGLVD